MELPDGDFIDLDWTSNVYGPIVIILHGLEGSTRSHYIGNLLSILERNGMRGVVMHFRNCSEEPNRMAISYTAGETGDLAYLVTQLKQREPQTPLATVGFSLGGNVLLKWLGENGNNTPISAAVAISVPYDLAMAADTFTKGFAQAYQWYLLRSMRFSYLKKFFQKPSPLKIDDLKVLKTMWDFDDQITAPLHGYAGVHDYYSQASSRQYLKHIKVPTLLLHALDDPFMTPHSIPTETELSNCVTLELSDKGGHVGFVNGEYPWAPNYWLEKRITAYLKLQLFDNSSE